jgi:hypothetical protein
LGESREPAGCHHSVQIGSLGEDWFVIPPSLVSTVELEELLILAELESDPNGFAISITMPFGQSVDGRVSLATCVQPPWTFRDEEGEEDDQAGEHHLEPDREQPRIVAFDIQATSSGTRGQNGADEPGGVAKTSDHATISGVAGLHNPDRTSSGGNAHTKAHKESTTHHLSLGRIGSGEALDDGSDNDQSTSNNHADATTKGVDGGSNEGESADTANLIHGSDQASPDTLVLAIEMLEKVFLVGEKATKQHGVEAVHCLAEEADQQGKEEKYGPRLCQWDWLLEQGLVEGLASLDFLNLDNLDQSEFVLSAWALGILLLTSLALSIELRGSTTSAVPWGFS